MAAAVEVGTLHGTLHETLHVTLQEYAPQSMVRTEDVTVTNAVLKHGKLFVGNPIHYKLMQPNACHNNVYHLWKNNKIANMCVGYALAPDRTWRFHSWGLSHNLEIVETTAPFLLYFGCVLQKQAE
jgi:hypothetical protein